MILGNRYQILTHNSSSDLAGNIRYALDMDTNQTVLVKMHKSCSPALVEISALQRVEQVLGCVRYLGDYAVEQGRFIVIEWIRGTSLLQCIPTSGIQTLNWFTELVKIVQQCHSRNVFHRDLKPENVIVDLCGNLHLVDFGSAIISEDGKVPNHAKGSPAITPPELLCENGDGWCSGGKIDVWGLGVTLYMMVTGRLPFQGENVFDLFNRISQCSVDFDLISDRKVRSVLEKMLVKNPKDRISIEETLRELQQ